MKAIIHNWILIPCLIVTAMNITANNPNDLLKKIWEQAIACNQAGDPEQAVNYYKEAIVLAPHFIGAHYNMAYSLKQLGRLQEAIEHYTIVLANEPDSAFAHLGIAQAYLGLGDFKRGFKEFLWRSPEIQEFPLYTWHNTNLHGVTILLRSEWGFGDCFQFIRFAKKLKQQGATVIMQTYPAIEPIIALCPYVDGTFVIGKGTFPANALHIPILSLPLALETTFDDITMQAPYLFADAQLIEEWRTKLAHDTNFKIGICWQGSCGDSPPGLNKNIPLAAFAPIAQLPNVSLYSLQKITGFDEHTNTVVQNLGIKLFENDFDESHGRFMDTAAVMNNLDLIITMDTSIAHLAGAMGVPVWILLPKMTDWRWMINQTTSPWYPTMRLFRQPTRGDWASVMKHVKDELMKII